MIDALDTNFLFSIFLFFLFVLFFFLLFFFFSLSLFFAFFPSAFAFKVFFQLLVGHLFCGSISCQSTDDVRPCKAGSLLWPHFPQTIDFQTLFITPVSSFSCFSHYSNMYHGIGHLRMIHGCVGTVYDYITR